MAKLHYDKKKLEQEYTESFGVFLKALVYGIGFVLAFFLILIVYLGSEAHTKHKPQHEQFKDRFTHEYEGALKLPYYEE